MTNIYCDTEDCENSGVPLECIGDDSRQEWYEAYYECHICGQKKIHRREFDQNGLVESDEIITVTEEKKDANKA